MKPIHKVAGTDLLRKSFMYIQVKDGRVRATNTHILIDFATEEVFGKGLIHDFEEMYFSASEWAATSMWKATEIERDGFSFQAKIKTAVVGMCKALSYGEFFAAAGEKFADVKSVYPSNAGLISQIGMSPKLLADVFAAFGRKENQFSFRFVAPTRPVYIQHVDFDGFALLFPLMVKTDALGHLPCDLIPETEDLLS